MRLLNIGTFRFEEFNADLPRYAILSHRWELEEVSFDEFYNPATRQKKGYRKIWGFCQQASSQGYHYAWVDTSCIDKKNFTELAEAVNSMFSWYKNSSMCMTYLSDFRLRPGMNQEQFESELGKSQWFKRGWTLQELIAPANVEFYDSNWRYFGTKRDLAGVIAKITGISEALLWGKRDLKKFSCAQKMSWAANRRTTRPEDRTYSLLGLFGVSLPLIYDGDGSKAFKRLQEEIIKNSTDQSIFAWVQHGPLPSIRHEGSIFDRKCSLLAPSPDCFRFSSKIVPCKGEESTTPYSLTNTGLEITQRIHKVRFSGGLVLLEILLECHHEDHEDRRVTITAVGSEAFYTSITDPPRPTTSTDEQPTFFQPAPSAVRLYTRLQVSRVEPRYLGPVTLNDGVIPTKKSYKTMDLRISPTFADTDQNCASADTSWMDDPRCDVITLKRMAGARQEVQELYEEIIRKQETDIKNILWGVGVVTVGLYAFKSLLDASGDSRDDHYGDERRERRHRSNKRSRH
jgi:hypothetical protein